MGFWDCGKTFTFTTEISYFYETKKAPCLNGDPHEYKPTATSPKYYTRMFCPMCGDYREPTDEERILHGIPSFEDYKKSLTTEQASE